MLLLLRVLLLGAWPAGQPAGRADFSGRTAIAGAHPLCHRSSSLLRRRPHACLPASAAAAEEEEAAEHAAAQMQALRDQLSLGVNLEEFKEHEQVLVPMLPRTVSQPARSVMSGWSREVVGTLAEPSQLHWRLE